MKKVKINGYVLSALVICLFASGCSNYKELNEISVIVGIGIDQNDNPELPYQVTYQVMNPSAISPTSSSGGKGLHIINYTVTAKTLLEAYQKVSATLPRKNYISHLSLIIIGEEFARNGIGQLFDFLERENQVRTSIPVVIAHDITAEYLLSVVEPTELIPVKNIISTSQNNHEMYGISSEVQIYEAISALNSDGREMLITGINTSKRPMDSSQMKNLETATPSVMEVKGLAMFRKGKLVGWLYGELARSAQLVTSEIKRTPVVLPCSKYGDVTVLVKQVKSKLKTDIKNNQPVLHVSLTMLAEIRETTCKTDIGNSKVLKSLEEQMENEIKKQIKQAISVAQKEKADIFGFGDNLYLTNPVFWHQHKEEWDKLFSEARISVKVNGTIENTGMRTEPYNVNK
jgi:spore germination protein KC